MKTTRRLVNTLLVISALLFAFGAMTVKARPYSLHGTPSGQILAPASSGAPLGDQFLITDQPVDTENPVVAYNSQGQEYLVVWWNDRPANDDIYAQRVSKNGTLIGTWFAVAWGTSERQYPQVAYNSQQNEYLVVWLQYDPGLYSVRGQRLAATGQLLGGTIDVTLGVGALDHGSLTVAYDSTDNKYLVVHSDYYTATSTHALKAQALNSDGTPWGASFDITSTTASLFDPDLAYNPLRNEFLLVWEQGAILYDVLGRRVKMLGGAGWLGSNLGISFSTGTSKYDPHVAALPRSPEGQYLVVLSNCKDAMCNQIDTEAQLVASDGSLEGGALTFPTPFGFSYQADVGGCGQSGNYFMAWENSNTTTDGDIAGRSVTVGGVAQPDVWLGGNHAGEPAVACGPHGDFLVVYMNKTTTATYDIWGRLVGNRVYIPLLLR